MTCASSPPPSKRPTCASRNSDKRRRHRGRRRAKNGGGALQIELRSNDGAALDAAAEKAMNTLRAIDGVTDVNSSYVEGMPELRLTVDRQKLKAYGTSLQDVDTVFASAISGLSAGEPQERPQ